MNRSRFLLSSSAVALSACSASGSHFSPAEPHAWSAELEPSTTPVTRLEIAEFSEDAALVAAFRSGVAALRAVTNAEKTNSYDYWHNSHWMANGTPPRSMETVWNQCRHRVSYFFGWHRGFLAYFERAIRQISGNPKFALPYWDYYTNPKLPHIFADPQLSDGRPNPLYWKRRRGNTISGLSYRAFAPSITTFPFGPGETYETVIEPNPHGHVHDQVGGSMGSVPTAAADPIFWVHHSNIDRYWSAWIAAGGKRHMPAADDRWWQQLFFYNLSRSWRASVRQMNDSKRLGYVYSDLTLPKPPPNAALPARPAIVAPPRANAVSPVALRNEGFTIEIPVRADLLHSPGLSLELRDAVLTDAGVDGGYSFGVYLNLRPAALPLSMEDAFCIGDVGPFVISMPRMASMTQNGGPTIRFALHDALERQRQLGFAEREALFVSIVPRGAFQGVSSTAELIRFSEIAAVG